MAKKVVSTALNKPRPAAPNPIVSYLMNPMVIIGGVTVITILVIVLAVMQNQPYEISDVEVVNNLARTHVDNPVYAEKDLPPMGGAHNPVWMNCGIYTEPIPTGNAVHSLEHGAVWITYDPNLPLEDIAKLQDLARGGSFRLLSPFPGLAKPVVAVAWGHRLELDSVDDARLGQFVKNYEQGPQTPEVGATCRGGLGQPQT